MHWIYAIAPAMAAKRARAVPEFTSSSFIGRELYVYAKRLNATAKIDLIMRARKSFDDDLRIEDEINILMFVWFGEEFARERKAAFMFYAVR